MSRGAAPAVETAFYPNDLNNLPDGSESITPHSGEGARLTSKRKQTLLNLLDALNELSKDDDLAASLPARDEQPSSKDDATGDERFQREGRDAFNQFQRRIVNLDKELRSFANATRQLGSSAGILSSSFQFRERLAQIQYLFRENAADLFPQKVHRQPIEQLVNQHLDHFKKGRRAHMTSSTVLENMDREDFPHQLRMFAQDIITFLDHVNEFPEFVDDAVNTSILSLQCDLNYWVSCLKTYEGQFRYPAVQKYLHDLSTEMGEHLDNITSSLSIFVEIGVPTIRFSQNHDSANLLNLSTIAIFFSAVTATTLQFSFTQVDTALANSVNGFWFTSLVFSIGAAVNSMLAVTWKQAMYRSPGHHVPWWILVWIKRSPLAFLVLSVACFSIGLVLFAYSSGQHKVTATVTTVFSACSCFGLAAVSTWIASERYIFTRHKGKQWLGDILSKTPPQVWALLLMVPGVTQFNQVLPAAARTVTFWMRCFAVYVKDVAVHLAKRILCIFNTGDASSPEMQPPNSTSPENFPSISTFPRALGLQSISEEDDSSADGPLLDGIDEKAEFNESSSASRQVAAPAKRRAGPSVHSSEIVRATAHTAFNVPQRQRSSDKTRSKRHTEPVNYGMMHNPGVVALVPKLKSFQKTQDLGAHQAMVRHLQFSPDGKKLATSSWDMTSLIIHVGESSKIHRMAVAL